MSADNDDTHEDSPEQSAEHQGFWRMGAGTRRFDPGCVVITEGAARALIEAMMPVESLLDRHLCGDWGDICEEDREENERGLRENLRLLSVYTLATTGVTLWVITEWDRSATTLLLPDEY